MCKQTASENVKQFNSIGRSIPCAVLIDAVSMRNSVVLYGELFGPILKYWILDDVSYSAFVEG